MSRKKKFSKAFSTTDILRVGCNNSVCEEEKIFFMGNKSKDLGVLRTHNFVFLKKMVGLGIVLVSSKSVQIDFYSSTVQSGSRARLPRNTNIKQYRQLLSHQTSQSIWMGGKGKMDILIGLNTVAINYFNS